MGESDHPNNRPPSWGSPTNNDPHIRTPSQKTPPYKDSHMRPPCYARIPALFSKAIFTNEHYKSRIFLWSIDAPDKLLIALLPLTFPDNSIAIILLPQNASLTIYFSQLHTNKFPFDNLGVTWCQPLAFLWQLIAKLDLNDISVDNLLQSSRCWFWFPHANWQSTLCNYSFQWKLTVDLMPLIFSFTEFSRSSTFVL